MPEAESVYHAEAWEADQVESAKRMRGLAAMSTAARTRLREQLLAHFPEDWCPDIVDEFDQATHYVARFTADARGQMSAFVDLFRTLEAWAKEAT